ncbi:MAG: hypothetical protein IT373_12610 [Polyangiaceae bacterium]|nr:hypothetical protein [Polyangiaceae bacterium]
MNAARAWLAVLAPLCTVALLACVGPSTTVCPPTATPHPTPPRVGVVPTPPAPPAPPAPPTPERPQRFCTPDGACPSGQVCDLHSCVGSCPACADCNHVCVPAPADVPPDVACVEHSDCMVVSTCCDAVAWSRHRAPPPEQDCRQVMCPAVERPAVVAARCEQGRCVAVRAERLR